MFPRYYDAQISSLLRAGQVLVLYGPRQVGKTTLFQAMILS